MGLPDREPSSASPEGALPAFNALLAHSILGKPARAHHQTVGQKIPRSFVVDNTAGLRIKGRGVTHLVAGNTEIQVQEELDPALLGEKVFHGNFFEINVFMEIHGVPAG